MENVSTNNDFLFFFLEKEGERRKKGEEEKKAMAVLLVFIMATLGIVFGQKKKRTVGRKVLKNPVQSDPRLMALKKANEWPRLVKPFN